MPWPDAKTRIEIYPERSWSRLGKLLGMQDVLIGSPDFDDRYVIKGSDVGQLKTLLNASVQQQIERLRQLLHNGDIYISISGGVLLVKKRSLLRDYNPLLQLTELSLGLFDHAMLTLEEGIEFLETAVLVDAEPREITEAAICQICGDGLTLEVVYCRRCRTPHHPDCWHYYGACSTYGCKETQYTRPKAKRIGR